jgi:hypothetical protein
MPDPATALFFFLRKRYSEIIPMFIRAVPSALTERLSKFLVSIRDSFLRVGIATSVMCYRRFLQYIDIKMTELAPYSIFTASLTQRDVERLRNAINL